MDILLKFTKMKHLCVFADVLSDFNSEIEETLDDYFSKKLVEKLAINNIIKVYDLLEMDFETASKYPYLKKNELKEINVFVMDFVKDFSVVFLVKSGFDTTMEHGTEFHNLVINLSQIFVENEGSLSEVIEENGALKCH
jgi:hypothetical protein